MVRSIVIIFSLLLVLPLFGEDAFKDHMVQSPKLDAPKRGSLKGDFAELGMSALSQKSGSFTIDLPIKFPSGRGTMQYPYKVSYSPSFGLSEYGIGFSPNLRIYRSRELGVVNFQDDQLMSPWGALKEGFDGYYYSKDLRSKIKAQLNFDSITVYLKDGSTLIFGDDLDPIYNERLDEDRVYGWYLKESIDQVGKKTSYSYIRYANDEKPLLKTIHYGGLGDDFQYEVEFLHFENQRAFVDYSTGTKLKRQRRVDSVVVRSMVEGSFQEIYRYNLSYYFPLESPGYYISSMQKVYIGGDKEPEIIFNFDYPKEYLQQASWKREPLLDPLAQKFKGMLTNYSHTSFEDFNRDGDLDFEVGVLYENYHRTAAGFEKVELGTPQGEVNPYCIFPVVFHRQPRSFIQVMGPGTEKLSYNKTERNDKSYYIFCQRDGTLEDVVELPKFWVDGSKTVFSDINKDSRPDLLHLRGDSYEVAYNISENNQVAFDEPTAPAPIFLPASFSSFWIKDINGDGNSDLVLKGDSTIYVHHGQADGSFQKNYLTFDFYLPSGVLNSKNLKDSNVLFVDANKDSLPDILLQGSGFVTLHLNTGSSFIQTYIPGLFAGPQFYANMVVANLTGAGESQILSSIRYGGENFLVTLDLDRPSLGLLKSLDDGKGNVLEFSYKKADAQIGVEHRKSVLGSMVKKMVGDGIKESTATYANIELNSVTKGFLGFENVETVEKDFGSITYQYGYMHDLDMLLKKESYSIDRPNFVKYEENTYEEICLEGICYPELATKRVGHKDLSTSQYVESYATYTYDDYTLCKLAENKTDGSLNYSSTIIYDSISAFANHLACLPKDITIAGNDYSHSMEIVRDGQGRPTTIKRGSAPQSTLQTINYGTNGLISSIDEAGKGVTTFNYDNSYRFNEVINPDTTRIYINDFETLNDSPKNLITDRAGTSFIQDFRFDGQGRLHKLWDNLGIFSEINPKTSYQYLFATGEKPGKTFEVNRVEKRAGITATGENIILTDGAGKDLATLVQIDEGYRVTKLTKRLSNLGITQTFSDYFLSIPRDIHAIKIENLDYERHMISDTQQDMIGSTSNTLNTIQDGVIQNIEKTTTIENGLLSEYQMENSAYTRVNLKNGFNNLVQFKDEANNTYTYRKDSLGRIRYITFPDGSGQAVSYDQNLGKISGILRDGLGSIEYSYDPITTLLSEKRKYDRNLLLSLQENYIYDSIGRITQKTMLSYKQDGTADSTAIYSYTYDQGMGQLGLLSKVEGPNFTKQFIYRPDGKVLLTTISILGWRQIELANVYTSHGELLSQNKKVVDLTNNSEIVGYTMQNEFDRFGRLLRIIKDGAYFLHTQYNSFGELSYVDIVGEKSLALDYDPVSRKLLTHKEQEGSTTIFKQDLSYSNRGFIDENDLEISGRNITQNYSYDPRGFLSSMGRSDIQDLDLSYTYSDFGFMESFTSNGTTDTYVMTPTQWNIGSEVYALDTLGRVTGKATKAFSYGPTGRISEVKEDNILKASYFYDEENNPILKVYANGSREMYHGNFLLNDTEFYEPVEVGSRMMGYFKNGQFFKTSQDHLNTNILDESDQVNLATPFGTRENRTEVSKIMDYALKGYDQDIEAVRMGHRFYDPNSRRFITPDSYIWENVEELEKRPFESNLYSYARNNPINFFDPTGDLTPLEKPTIITSLYGERTMGGSKKMHSGVDIRAAKGTNVRATSAGKVVAAGYHKRGGSRVIISHKDKSYTVSRHMKPNVQKGQTVREGQSIGKTCTGPSCGTDQPHLHFERVAPNETSLSDPTGFLQKEERKVGGEVQYDVKK